ncbi:MAG TPA: hypothetical protein VMU33_07440 [Burkholderiaceae bacterium]|nr:hypothetical protein [Burkholderiaceae bacterium]
MRHADTNALPAVADERSASLVAIFVVSFAVFLLIALVGGSLGLKWRSWFPGAEGGQSLPGAVRSAVYSFMSYLP